MNKKNIIKYSLISSIVLVCVLLDQISKIIAESNLKEYQSVEVIKGFFDLTLCYNTGGAWSILSNSTWLLILISVVALGFMIYTLIKSKDMFYVISASIFSGGLIGNLIDRLFNIGVVDFLDFNIFGYDFPVFNIADTFIVVSAILIGVSIILEDKKENKKVKEENENGKDSGREGEQGN
jgi:signal peptidase II